MLQLGKGKKQLLNLLINVKDIAIIKVFVSIIHCNSNKLLFVVSEALGCHRYLQKRQLVRLWKSEVLECVKE